MKKVLVGGAFNILHPGHIFFLSWAKKLGDFLIVVIANDRTVKRNKGYVITPMNDRKRIVEGIRFVDKVVVGNSTDMFRVVEKEKPNIIALGFDQKIDMKKLKGVIAKNRLKIKIVRIKKYGNYSTKKIIEKIKNK